MSKSSDYEYTVGYWAENFRRDVEAFRAEWENERRQRPSEYPETMALSQWDDQFLQWLQTQIERESE